MEQREFWLEIIKGKNKGQCFRLLSEAVTIGRRLTAKERKSNWILLDETSLSRIHAQLIWNEKERAYLLLHKSRMKPTLVNSKEVEEVYLSSQDRIQMGDMIFRFWEGPIDKKFDYYQEDGIDRPEPAPLQEEQDFGKSPTGRQSTAAPKRNTPPRPSDDEAFEKSERAIEEPVEQETRKITPVSLVKQGAENDDRQKEIEDRKARVFYPKNVDERGIDNFKPLQFSMKSENPPQMRVSPKIQDPKTPGLSTPPRRSDLIKDRAHLDDKKVGKILGARDEAEEAMTPYFAPIEFRTVEKESASGEPRETQLMKSQSPKTETQKTSSTFTPINLVQSKSGYGARASKNMGKILGTGGKEEPQPAAVPPRKPERPIHESPKGEKRPEREAPRDIPAVKSFNLVRDKQSRTDIRMTENVIPPSSRPRTDAAPAHPLPQEPLPHLDAQEEIARYATHFLDNKPRSFETKRLEGSPEREYREEPPAEKPAGYSSKYLESQKAAAKEQTEKKSIPHVPAVPGLISPLAFELGSRLKDESMTARKFNPFEAGSPEVLDFLKREPEREAPPTPEPLQEIHQPYIRGDSFRERITRSISKPAEKPMEKAADNGLGQDEELMISFGGTQLDAEKDAPNKEIMKNILFYSEQKSQEEEVDYDDEAPKPPLFHRWKGKDESKMKKGDTGGKREEAIGKAEAARKLEAAHKKEDASFRESMSLPIPDYWELVIVKGPQESEGKSYVINNAVVTIGNGLRNDIVLQDEQLANTHVRIYFRDEKFYLQKVVKTQPIFINGKILITNSDRDVVNGDVIQISSKTKIMFRKRI
jgi:pSer/pThr/pTyr-binding forkhead associated (FHA) protein